MSTTPPSLRRATDDDAPAIHDLVHAAYAGYISLIGRKPAPMLTDQLAAVRTNEVWVLVDDRRIVGVIESIARADHLWIDNVAIDPDRQGRGLGRRLLRHAEDRACAMGLDEIRLATNERFVANIAMYERNGYVETHREPVSGTDVVHFRKPLESQS